MAEPRQFSLEEQARIRAALFAFAKSHKIGVIRLARAITDAHPHKPEIAVKTLQRHLAGQPVNSLSLSFYDAFASKQPHRPTVWHALGDALHAIYRQTIPDDVTGHHKIGTIELTVFDASQTFAFARQTDTRPYKRIFDGVLVQAGLQHYFVMMRDRATLEPRFITLRDVIRTGPNDPENPRSRFYIAPAGPPHITGDD